MLGWNEDDQGPKPERVLLSPAEYPGSPPCAVDVDRGEDLRQAGNRAYGDGQLEEAVLLYSGATLLNPSDHLAYSNRSACWLRMGRAIEALDDAELCVKLAPAFARGFLRKGTAEQLLNRRVDAQASFKRGLGHDPDSAALVRSLRGLHAEGGGLQATLYHVLFVSPHLQMDRLFQVLEDPDRLTVSYVEQHKAELDAQFECLTQTLRVDLGLLLASPVLRDAYDRVTFACGQLLQWAPEAVSRHLGQAQRIVEGLGLALRCGWGIHHGVAKFSANALTILATSEGANDDLRREAVRLLLGGMLRWLIDPTPEPESPPEDRDVCGCTFLSPRLSAATWLERLFEHGTQHWVREECEKFPSIVPIVVHLCLVVRDERAQPLGLPCLLRLPKVAKAVMECEAVIDLSTCNRDTAGRRDGRRWLVRQRGKGTGTASAATIANLSHAASSSATSASTATASTAASASSASASSTAAAPADAPMAPAADAADPPAFDEEDEDTEDGELHGCKAFGEKACCKAASASGPLPRGADSAQADEAEGPGPHAGQVQRLLAPAQRLGDWIMASLGYLLVFVDDDALFAAHACSALHRLAVVVPDGVTRLAHGLWVGLPMLERLSMLACQHTAALELLETIARHSQPACVAMCSLASALARAMPPAAEEVTARPVDEQGDDNHSALDDAATPGHTGSDPPQPGPTPAPLLVPDDDESEAATFAMEVEEEGALGEHDHDHERDGLGEPSWVECYHELHDELWIHSGPNPPKERPPPSPRPSLVMLGNFCEAATQVPVVSTFAFLAGAAAVQTPLVEASAVPAVWNPRSADAVDARLVVDEVHEMGSVEWQTGKDSAVVLLLRSMIQRSPATPDWAAAVWLCAEAGARAVIVVNDLADDGPGQPAFRMGLFGSPAPPVAAFMINGKDGEAVRAAARSFAPAELRTLSRDGPADPGSAGGTSLAPPSPQGCAPTPTPVVVADAGGQPGRCGTMRPPPWPLVLRVPQDVAQAWSLIETVHRAAPSSDLAGVLGALAGRMGLPEKRVWLTRRLQRYHRGDTDADEPVEPPLAFVECDREGDQLRQLRKQLVEKTGIAAPGITGEFEVRFREESSVGSAVMREWMDLIAQQAFLKSAHRLLVSYDNGATFMPDPAAPFINPQWKGDFELLGRLLGLALWHQVTLDLPIHPYICELLLDSGEEGAEAGPSNLISRSLKDAAQLQRIDEELHRHKVRWLLANDVASLGYDMPFTDVLLDDSRGDDTKMEDVSMQAYGSEADGDSDAAGTQPLPAVPEVVTPSDALPGDDRVSGPSRLRPFSFVQIALVPDGENRVVVEANKQEFVAALLEWRLRASLRGPVEAMLEGLRAAVPTAVLAEARRMLTPGEVHALLAGSREIDVENWERNTRNVGGLTPNSLEVRLFWKIVRQWSADGRQDRLQDLLQFATGSRRIPVGGFAQLVGFNGGKHLFTLAKGAHLTPKSLPTSHACICTIDLPPWESLEAAQQKLLAATEAGRARFDEGTAGGDDEGID